MAVAIVPDDIDPVDGPYTARKVWAVGLDDDRRPVFMTRGVTGLPRPTRVREATIDGAPWDEQFGADLAYGPPPPRSRSARRLHLQVLPASRATNLGEGARVRLVHGLDEQEIYRSVAHPDEPAWLTLWAGDLDADGRLDLYMDLAPSFNLSRRVLFLSSGAAPGDMVREAAVFETHGAPSTTRRRGRCSAATRNRGRAAIGRGCGARRPGRNVVSWDAPVQEDS